MSTHGSATAESLRTLWPEIQKHGVNHLWIFGSRARGDAHAGSDLDVLVDFTLPPSFDHFMGLKLTLEDHLGTPVDLLSLSACHPRFLKAIQPELLHVA
jgi:predicted nucleotidyltransferase